MKLHQLAANLGIVTAGLLALSSAPARAFSFTTNFDAELAGSDAPKGNIFLKSVELGDGTTVSDFTLVNGAKILFNEAIVRGVSPGGASADKGDLADGVKQENVSEANVVAALGNLNLNNIIDTEDKGSFTIDLFFEKAINTLFLWERGKNSKLEIQALDSTGTPIGSMITVNSRTFDDAGYSINTTEIAKSQVVGSLGISLADLGITGPFSGIRTGAMGATDAGPDFKIVGTLLGGDEPAATPEPSALVGLGLAAGAALTASRRRRVAQSAEA